MDSGSARHRRTQASAPTTRRYRRSIAARSKLPRTHVVGTAGRCDRCRRELPDPRRGTLPIGSLVDAAGDLVPGASTDRPLCDLPSPITGTHLVSLP